MANYLRESWSSDLDFGTGEWSASAWVNVPVTLPAASFPVVDGELVNNGTGWVDANGDGTLDGWTLDAGATTSISNGVLTITPGGSYSGISQTISTVPGKVYRVRFEKLNAVSCYVLVAGEGFLGANGPGSGGSGIAEGQFVATSSTTSISITVHPTTGWGPLQVGQISVRESVPLAVADRSFSSGPSVKFGVIARSISYYETAKKALLTATAFDGTTTRTVTTTAAYNTATWAKAEACYTTDGTLAIRVNGVEVAATRGNPLLTLNNSNAVLTIGNSYAADAPFPGSIALLKLSATVPTPEQSVWMYEQEKQLFRDGAQCVLPDSGAIVDLTYDDATDKWIAVSATNESEWSGLVRTSVTAVPAGSYTKAAAASGVQLLARSTTSPGVDITIPAYGLREELVKRAESAARLNAQLATFDYVGGFTASTTTGSTSITSVAGLSYPVSAVGAQVTGAGIPAGTAITAVSGATAYLSKAATATGTAVQISFTDFILPVGYEAKAVLSVGSVKTEGSTKDYTRLFDGFKETIRFGTAPGYQAAVQIQATRSAT